MSIALTIFIIIVILLVIILIYLLSVNKNITAGTNKKLVKNNTNLLIIDLDNIQFPKNIENMNSDALFKASKMIFDSHCSLDYSNKLPSSLDKIEWHTWQVSILLRFLKSKNKFFISNTNDKIFHDVILTLSETQMDQDMQRIYRKYLENVNIHKNRDDLSKDVIWAARDVSIILYRIINVN
jgi:hypothetical protein